MAATHFAAIQLDDDDVQRRATEVHEQLVARFPALKPLCVPVPKLHVTLAVLRCPGPGEEAAARDAFLGCAPLLPAHVGLAPALDLPVGGLGSFGDLRVLFADLDRDAADCQRLLGFRGALVRRLRDRLGAQAVVDDPEAEFHPHATLLKQSRNAKALRAANRERGEGAPKVQAAAEAYLFDELRGAELRFGTQRVGEVQLLRMTTAADGYYDRVAALPLAAAPLPVSLRVRVRAFSYRDILHARLPAGCVVLDARPRDAAALQLCGRAVDAVRAAVLDGRTSAVLAVGCTDGVEVAPRVAREVAAAVNAELGDVVSSTSLQLSGPSGDDEEVSFTALPPRSGRRGARRRRAAQVAAPPPPPPAVERRAPAPAAQAQPEEIKLVWNFAYGANINRHKLEVARRITPYRSEPGVLRGWQLWFNHRGGFGNVQPSAREGAAVHGVLHLMDEAQWAALSKSESGYLTQTVQVEAYCGERIEALVYVSKPTQHIRGHEHWDPLYAAPGGLALPVPERYAKLLVRGAQEWELDADYQRWLQGLPVVDARKRGREYYELAPAPVPAGGGGAASAAASGEKKPRRKRKPRRRVQHGYLAGPGGEQ